MNNTASVWFVDQQRLMVVALIALFLVLGIVYSNVVFARPLGDLGYGYGYGYGEEPPTDVCPNIEGTQESLPEGFTFDGEGNCVEPEPEEEDGTPEISGGGGGGGPLGGSAGDIFGGILGGGGIGSGGGSGSGTGDVLGAATTQEEQIAALQEQLSELQEQLVAAMQIQIEFLQNLIVQTIQQMIADLQAQIAALQAQQ